MNNNTIKLDEMTTKLAQAIDNMSGALSEKLEAIRGIIESTSATTAQKLAAIEAAIKAQALSMESKMQLLEDAIKALPDYSAQLEAIKTAIANLPDYGDKLSAIKAAINAMPNYSDKFDAVVAALNAMKTQIEALGDAQAGIATQIANVTTAINNLIASVNSGNTSAAAALAQIIAKLDELKAAIGSGGSGGGGGEGGGGEGGGGTTPSTMEYVDLGLPSGLKWARCNLGASKPGDNGDYYAWGETEPKTDYVWATYKWGTEDNLNKYNKTDRKTVLDPEDDAATAALGAPWRMPTAGEILELVNPDNCTWTWIKRDDVNGYGVNGYKVVSKKNGNSIFLPAAGNRNGYDLDGAGRWGGCWSSSLVGPGSDYARSLHFGSGQHDWSNSRRCYGWAVRPVRP
ncbi:methyl-accepting chemotaxis protein [Porphyromonas crevioricanis]|nr:methyl-accepting chemotaxis protein [Porphyromonas crevioricanis]